MKNAISFACAALLGVAVVGCAGEASKPNPDQAAPSTDEAAQEITGAADNTADDAAENANTQEP